MSEQSQPAIPPSEFRKGIVLTGSGSLVSLVALFLETLISARLLTTGEFGTYVLLVTIVNFLALVVDFGIQTAVTQKIAASNQSEQVVLTNSVMLFRLLIIAVVSVVLWPIQGLLPLDRSIEEYLIYVPLMLVGMSMDELLQSLLQGFQIYQRRAAAQILRSILRLGLSAALLLVFQLGEMALIYSWIISFGLSIAYQLPALPTVKRFTWERGMLGEMLRFGFPLYLTRFLSFAVGRADVILLAALAGPASVAYYAVATRIPDALQRLAESYLAVFFPTMSAMLARGRNGEAGQLLSRSLRLISFGTALIALTAVVFNQQIIILLFGEKYAASSWAFALLMIGFHIIFTLNLMGYTLTAAGQSMRSFGASLVQAVANIAGNLLLIPSLSFVGSALADMLSAYAATGSAIWFIRRGVVQVALTPHIRQTLLLFGCTGWFWWAQPEQVIYKLAIIGFFIGLSLALSTISWSDIQLVLPVQRPRGGPLADVDG